MRRSSGGFCGETRASGLWGTRRGGRGSTEGRSRDAARRGLLALLVLALAAPLAASAGGRKDGPAGYLAPSLRTTAESSPDANVPVIVLSDSNASRAQHVLDEYTRSSTRLGIVSGAAGEVRAGSLPDLAQNTGVSVIPDQPVVLDSLGGTPNVKAKGPKNDNGNANHAQSESFSSTEIWPSAVGLESLWPMLASSPRHGHDDGHPALGAPTIAFVDSGIDASRSDFGNRVLAQVNLTSLPGNSPGDGRGHGTFIAGLAAGSAPRHAGAAPTAGIVSIDVMDDQGMARTSDVIAAAQWILRNHEQYDIRVANFSLHSATPSSFRWDPLDKAIEQLWFAGVVVVTSSGNGAVNGQQSRIKYAPANDPFAITVGALDLHGAAGPDRASVANWSSWGYTYDGFAKPELSAPGRRLLGPVPADSTLAQQRPAQLVHSPEGLYMRLSGTSLAAPIVSGLAADVLALHPDFTPDQVKGALMVAARPVPQAAGFSAGVGEPFAPDAVGVSEPPNPNLALDQFVVPSDAGALAFDDAAWLEAVHSSASWNAVSWLDGWAGAAWSAVSWSDVSWSDVSWSDVSWSDVSWADVSWADVSWADSLNPAAYGDVAP
ncbi:MAG: S8 family serine peptidase [Gaiellaceae bacterium]